MKFFVNFLSAFRIAAAFALIPMLMFQWYWVAFVVYVLAAVSDFLDGWLAKKYNATSKIGGVIDHIGDKLLVAIVMIMVALMLPFWFIVVPMLIMIARELYISGLREFLGTQKVEMPVPAARFSMGKIKTTLQMITLAAFVLLFALTTTPRALSPKMMQIMNTLSKIGIIGMWISLVASVWSATQYTMTFVEKIKKLKK